MADAAVTESPVPKRYYKSFEAHIDQPTKHGDEHGELKLHISDIHVVSFHVRRNIRMNKYKYITTCDVEYRHPVAPISVYYEHVTIDEKRMEVRCYTDGQGDMYIQLDKHLLQAFKTTGFLVANNGDA